MSPKSQRTTSLLSFAAVAAALLAAPAFAQNPPVPFERTEADPGCVSFEQTRQPFFGDTHVHTGLSFDAAIGGVVTTPSDAYDFAKGAAIDLPPYVAEVATRSAQLRRPLDFTALSDHAEFFGEVRTCLTEGLPGYDDPVCVAYRAEVPSNDPGTGSMAAFTAPYLAVESPDRYDFCGVGGGLCEAQASLVWTEVQDAAELHYDRSTACSFTTFVGYEWTGAPAARNLHRNVIFRNADVPALPISYVEEPRAEGLYQQLDAQCLEAVGSCDVLSIPHNSNLSDGLLFRPLNSDDLTELTVEDAALRARMEPLVEITQHKGDSECRPGILSNDEQCSFEKMSTVLLGVPSGAGVTFDPRLFVRNVLKEGLQLEESLGANPFPLGIIGSTDTHTSMPGATNEEDYGADGHLGTRDATPAFIMSPIQLAPLGGAESNPGGLAVIWAEENSRDALFSAMRRREVYGTSGTRPLLRFFAGDYKGDPCADGTVVAAGYERGVPMGAEIGALRGSKSPKFLVQASKDPGPGGIDLQRVQIIKGWLNSNGTTAEEVFEVAGDPDNGATVDESTCVPTGVGVASSCTLWEDPDFDPDQRAFYYARIIENPTCRWSAHVCNAEGVDCDLPNVPVGMEECCNEELPKVIQERAWSSPIFYRPESFGKFKGQVRLHGSTGENSMKVKGGFHNTSGLLDPTNDDLTIAVTDDGDILNVTIPAGTMTELKPGRSWVLEGQLGFKKLSLKINGSGKGKLTVQTEKVGTTLTPFVDHFVHTKLTVGNFQAEHSRMWTVKGSSLKAKN
jgi:hypothetical protein